MTEYVSCERMIGQGMILNEIYQRMKCEIELLNRNEISDKLMQLTKCFADLWQKLPERKKWDEMQKAVDLIDKEKYLSAIYMYSVFTFHIHNKKWIEEMLEMILKAGNFFSEDILYFLYWQIDSRFMNYPRCESEYGKVLHWRLFKNIYKKYAEKISKLRWVKESERNEGLVVVIIAQFLGDTHGPSKTAMDRCKTLMEAMNKRVLLINTAEVGSIVGEIPYIGRFIADYEADLCNKEHIGWKGRKIPFFQCENNMPNIEILNLLIERIVALKPQFIVEIGTGSILVNLISQCFPVLSVVTGFSRLSVTETQYQVSAASITDRERWILKQIGKDEKHIISTLFTFGLSEQRLTLSRKELGLPKDKFLITVIGMRLDREIDVEFFEMLHSVNNEKIGVVFIGKFEKFDEFLKRHSVILESMYNLGACSDVLAVLDQCDLFVNPIRLGGGTSAAEALSKGLPVVTTSYGDIGATAGEDFWVKDYCEMAKMINRYQQDRRFYLKQSELAKKRAEALLDTDGEFVKVIKEFGDRMGEHYI